MAIGEPVPSPQGDDEIGLFQNRQMLADRLTRHVEARAEFVKRLATVGAQAVKEFSPARIGQCFEHSIHNYNMQPFGCMSTLVRGTPAAEAALMPACVPDPPIPSASFRMARARAAGTRAASQRMKSRTSKNWRRLARR